MLPAFWSFLIFAVGYFLHGSIPGRPLLHVWRLLTRNACYVHCDTRLPAQLSWTRLNVGLRPKADMGSGGASGSEIAAPPICRLGASGTPRLAPTRFELILGLNSANRAGNHCGMDYRQSRA
jgi:hypothetical protein